jgi:hypothetical protein
MLSSETQFLSPFRSRAGASLPEEKALHGKTHAALFTI